MIDVPPNVDLPSSVTVLVSPDDDSRPDVEVKAETHSALTLDIL